METPDLFALFVRPLHRAGLCYMISGSLASIFYGEPRLTMDVDIAVQLDPKEEAALPELFPAAEFHLPPAEVVTGEIAHPTRGISTPSI